MKEVKKALEKCPCSDIVKESVSALLTTSAEDNISDQKFQIAVSYIDDARMPKVIAADGDQDRTCISNLAQVRSNYVTSVIDESLIGVVEAYATWSATRQREMAEPLQGFFTRCLETVSLCDLSISACSAQAAKEMFEIEAGTGVRVIT